MDLIKSRSLIFLSPSPLDTAALFSFCLNTIHSLQQIKLKKPGNKVWKRVNKSLYLVEKKKVGQNYQQFVTVSYTQLTLPTNSLV